MAQLLVYTKFQKAFPGSAFVTDFGINDLESRPSPASTVSVDRPSHDQPPADPLSSESARAEDTLASANLNVLEAGEALSGEGASPKTRPVVPRSIAVIGGTKFDATALETWVKSLPQDIVVVTGDGRGAEKALRALLSDRGIRFDVPLLLDIPNRLGVQIEAILSMTQDSCSPVVLLGEGSRVDTAKKWLKRGKWGREASEPLS